MALNKKVTLIVYLIYTYQICVYMLQMLHLRSKLMYASVVATPTSRPAQTPTLASPAKDRGNM